MIFKKKKTTSNNFLMVLVIVVLNKKKNEKLYKSSELCIMKLIIKDDYGSSSMTVKRKIVYKKIQVDTVMHHNF